MTPLRIVGAEILLPSGLQRADLLIRDGRIAAIGDAPEGAATLHAHGLLVAPAMIDIHGDAFERAVMPRPDVYIPLDVALPDADRQLAAQGIATAYHALTLSWEPGLRSVPRAEAFLKSLAQLRPRLAVEHRVQLRWETFATEAIPLIERALTDPIRPAVAFNDHTSMALRSFDQPVHQRPFEHSADYVPVPFDHPRLRARIASSARRAGLSEDAYLTLLERVWARRPDVPAAIARVSAAGFAARAPMLSHDDSQLEARAFHRARNVRIAEFPMSQDVARDARAHDEPVVLGAPNVLRGGSHIGSLSAAEMVEAGLCTILASDYHHPSMLAAISRLEEERRAPFPALWSLVSLNPARALGLTDRGEIAEGARADLVLLDRTKGRPLSARATLSGGRIAHLTGDLLG